MMRKALSLVKLQFRLIFQSKASLMMMFLLPILFTLIFGVAADSEGGPQGIKTYPIAVVDLDDSFASQALHSLLEAQPNLKLQLVTEAEMTELFADKALAAGVVIPEGFGQGIRGAKPVSVQYVTPPGGSTELAARSLITRQVERVSTDYRLAFLATEASADQAALEAAYKKIAADRESSRIDVETTPITHASGSENVQVSNVGNAAMGFSILFVMMMVFMAGGTILQERETGTWPRLLTTPTSRITLLVGYVGSFFLIGMAQFSILVAATSLLFGLRWGPILPLMTMAAAFVLCSTAMGLFLAGIVKTSAQQRSLSTVIVVTTSMLGGVYWSLDLVSDTMRRIGYLMPQAWAMDGFREVMMRGGSFAGLQWPLTVLLGLTLIFMTAGLLRIRYE